MGADGRNAIVGRAEEVGRGVRRWTLETLGDRADRPSALLVLGAAVGLGTGLLAVALIELGKAIQGAAFGGTVATWELLVVPTAGAFLVGLLITYWLPEPGGGPIVQVLRTLALRGGRFRAKVPFGTVLASGLALGTGGSGGREGPIVLVGGSLGSLIGRFFAVSEERMRTLVAAGAAAGIGASFNAPIGGMLFAIELIVRRFQARSLQVIVVASVVASVTAREIVGPEIIYEPTKDPYTFSHVPELGLYALLGLAAVAVGLAFVHGEDRVQRWFGSLRIWRPLRVAAGGLGVGLIALAVPEVLGTGEHLPPIDGLREPIQAMVDGSVDVGIDAIAILLLLAGAKLVASALSVGSGNAVGTFAPSIFIGAALGGAFGHAAQLLLPTQGVEPGAYALVGMAAVFSAVGRAPLTSILIVFELTGDYGLVLPLMLAVGVATFVADRLDPESIFSRPLRREGIVYAEPEDVDIMQTVTVGEIMTTDPDTVPADLGLEELAEEFRRTRHHGFPVVANGDRLVGVVTLADLRDAPTGRADLTVADICTRQPLTATPEDPVFRGLRRMAILDVGRLPVVDPDDHSRLVGLLRRADLVHAYQRAVTRSVGVQQRRDASRLRDLVGASFIEFEVAEGAPAAHATVRDVEWPERTVLTSVRRRGELILPHGDTELRPGDEVVVLAGPDTAERVRQLLAGGEMPREVPDEDRVSEAGLVADAADQLGARDQTGPDGP